MLRGSLERGKLEAGETLRVVGLADCVRVGAASRCDVGGVAMRGGGELFSESERKMYEGPLRSDFWRVQSVVRDAEWLLVVRSVRGMAGAELGDFYLGGL